MRKPTSGSFASLASGQNKRLRAENESLRRDKQRLEKSLEIANVHRKMPLVWRAANTR